MTRSSAHGCRRPVSNSLSQARNLIPTQPTVATAQGRQCDRLNVEAFDFLDEGGQAGLDILDPRSAAPMALGGEVDDVTRVVQAVSGIDEHLPRIQLLGGARLLVSLKVFRECF